MNNLIRAELLKLRTTRTFWWSVVAAPAFVPVNIALAIAKIGTPHGTSLDSAEGFRNVIAAASSGGVLVLLIGIVIMAGEFRFNTVTSTFLITPERKRVVGAKLAASSLVGLGIALVSSLLTIAIALPWLASRHVDLGSHQAQLQRCKQDLRVAPDWAAMLVVLMAAAALLAWSRSRSHVLPITSGQRRQDDRTRAHTHPGRPPPLRP